MNPTNRALFPLFLLVLLSCTPEVHAQLAATNGNFLLPPEGQNTGLEAGFEKTILAGGKPCRVTCTGWQHLGVGGATVEENTFKLSTDADSPTVQICQVMRFDPPILMPLRISAECRGDTEKVEAGCALYLDFTFDDGTPLWAVQAKFPPGTYDFRDGVQTFHPEKPVREIRAYAFLRQASGTAWFRNIYVGPVPLLPMRFQCLGGLFGQGTAAMYARPNTNDSDIHLQYTLYHPDGTLLASKVPGQSPLWIFTPQEVAPELVSAACHVNRNGETVHLSQLADTAPCDNARGYCVWTTTSMERIYPHSLPRVASDDATGHVPAQVQKEEMSALRQRLEHPTATLELARNEYESFQIAVLSPRELRDVEVRFSDLTHTSRKDAKIAATHLDWKQVGFVRAEKIQRHPADTEGMAGWWPDPLLPVQKFTLPAGQTQPLWVTLYAPPGTPAGTYHGTVRLMPQNAPATEIPLTVTVWDFELPAESHFPTAFALMDGFLEHVYDQRPTTPELRKTYGDFLLRHRLMPEGDISRTRLPVPDELEHYRGRGLGVFNLLNMVEDRGTRTWMCNSPPETYTPEFLAKMRETLAPCVETLRKRGLADRAYVYTFDERGEDYTEIITAFFGMVKAEFPEVATFTTSHFPADPEVMRQMNIDWLCPLTAAYDAAKAERCRAEGRKVWAYVCCIPDYPYMNILCRFPLIEAREIFWQAYRERFDGLLYWGVNIWTGDANRPIDPADGPFLDWSVESYAGGAIYGDGRLIYAGIDQQPIGSVRLANLRDGLEDYEYLHQAALHLDSPQRARQLADPLVHGMTDFHRSPAKLYRQRRALAEIILCQ